MLSIQYAHVVNVNSKDKNKESKYWTPELSKRASKPKKMKKDDYWIPGELSKRCSRKKKCD